MKVPGLWGRDIVDLLQPQGAPRQPMRGFEPCYADIVDYIIRCTHRIWEEKDLGLIRTHYGADCAVHTMAGPVTGIDAVIEGTTRTLAAFPDRTLVGEAVIWSGDENAGYLSSHRITSHATNLGSSEFGPATGRRIDFTTIADCLCRENLIVEEWLVRDNAAIALKLGFDPKAVGAAQAAADEPNGPAGWRLAAIADVRSQPQKVFGEMSLPPAREAEAFARAVLGDIWGLRRLGRVREAYAPYARLTAPAERRLFGAGEIIGWMVEMLAPLSRVALAVDHVAIVDEGPFQDIAVRWRLTGQHLNGRQAYILAVSHWRTDGERILEDWTVFDEIALHRQLAGGL